MYSRKGSCRRCYAAAVVCVRRGGYVLKNLNNTFPLYPQHNISPDIQVGMPLSSLVDKVLESKAKDLLPNISEVVDKLRESKTSDSPSATNPLSSLGNSSKSTAEKTTQEVLSKPKSTDFGSLPLPIDIPGLTSSTGGNNASPNTKKEPSAPLKSKPKASDISVKDNKIKGKAGQPKVPMAAKESVKREKESISEKDTATEEGGKEKDKHKSTVKLKKNKDDVVKDKGASVHKEKSQDGKAGLTEKPDDAKDKATNVRRDKPSITEKSDDAKEKASRDKSLESKPGDVEKTDQESHHGSKEFPTNESKGVSGAELEIQSNSRKVLPPRRRSARIASLSEDNGKEEGESENQKSREKLYEEEAVDSKSMSEEAVKAKSSSSSMIKKKRKQKAQKCESQKKRQRLLSSSTDEESEIQEYITSEEEPEDSGKYTSKNKSKLGDIYTKRAKKRALQQTAEDSPISVPQKKLRRISKSFNDGNITQSKEAADCPPLPAENIQKPHRRKSSQPQRLPVRSSKSPPVVITRYNRQIKPNRRYLDTSGEASEAGSEGEDEAAEEKHTPQESEAYTDVGSSDSEHKAN